MIDRGELLPNAEALRQPAALEAAFRCGWMVHTLGTCWSHVAFGRIFKYSHSSADLLVDSRGQLQVARLLEAGASLLETSLAGGLRCLLTVCSKIA